MSQSNYSQVINAYDSVLLDRRGRPIPGSEYNTQYGPGSAPVMGSMMGSSPPTEPPSSPITVRDGERLRTRRPTDSPRSVAEIGDGYQSPRSDPPSSPMRYGESGVRNLAFDPRQAERDYTAEQRDWHQGDRIHDSPQLPRREVIGRSSDYQPPAPPRDRDRRRPPRGDPYEEPPPPRRHRDDPYSSIGQRMEGTYDGSRDTQLPDPRRQSRDTYDDPPARRRERRDPPSEPAPPSSRRRGSERTYDDPPAPPRDRRRPPGPPPSQGLPPPPPRAPDRSRASLPDDPPTIGGHLPLRPSGMPEVTRSGRRGEISDEGLSNYITHLDNQYPRVSRRQREDWAAHYANTGIMIDGQFTAEEPQPSGRRRERRPHGSHGSGR
jgi:hypothetical protein